jgi:hypothetical protein
VYQVLLILLSLHIVVFDIRFHKITNASNFVLLSLLILHPHRSWVSREITAALIALIVTIIFKIGMGDLKLWLVLAFTNDRIVLSLRYFELAASSAALLALGALLRTRNIRTSIPLAPALLIPFLVVYLAI